MQAPAPALGGGAAAPLSGVAAAGGSVAAPASSGGGGGSATMPIPITKAQKSTIILRDPEWAVVVTTTTEECMALFSGKFVRLEARDRRVHP
jgi:hypothetical protein